MNQPRRTFLQSISALVGWVGLHVAASPKVIAEEIEDENLFRNPSEIAAIQKAFKEAMYSRRLPNGEWRLCAKRAYSQHRLIQVFFDHMIPAATVFDFVMRTSNVGVCLRSWSQADNSERIRVVKQAVDYALDNMQTCNLFETDHNAVGVIWGPDGLATKLEFQVTTPWQDSAELLNCITE